MNQVHLKEEDKLKIIELYNSGISTSEISKLYNNRNRNSIRALLKRRGFSIRPREYGKYNINEHYFDIIDSEEKAYFLGFLYADGYNNIRLNALSLVLQEKDLEILEKLKKLIESDKPISTYTVLKNNKTYYKLSITNKNISFQLEKLGCVQAKTFKITFPNWLREDLKRHFIRGYFDGDGSISKDSKDPSCSILGNCIFMSELSKYIKNTLNIHISEFLVKKNNKLLTLTISGRKQCIKFLDFLYKDSIIHLNRKNERYLNIYKIKN